MCHRRHAHRTRWPDGRKDRIVEHAIAAEEGGFSALWIAGGGGGDAMAAAAAAGRATSRLGVGTAVVATYLCHPYLMAARAVAAADAVGGGGRLTLGIGPSHRPAIEGIFGLSYDRPGQHTEEYLGALVAQLRGEAVSVAGEEMRLDLPPAVPAKDPVPVLLGALGPRLLRLAGEQADGTIVWMANARAVRSHVAPRINEAAAGVGRPAPRIVAGLPVAVHDDVEEARRVAAQHYAMSCSKVTPPPALHPSEGWAALILEGRPPASANGPCSRERSWRIGWVLRT